MGRAGYFRGTPETPLTLSLLLRGYLGHLPRAESRGEGRRPFPSHLEFQRLLFLCTVGISGFPPFFSSWPGSLGEGEWITLLPLGMEGFQGLEGQACELVWNLNFLFCQVGMNKAPAMWEVPWDTASDSGTRHMTRAHPIFISEPLCLVLCLASSRCSVHVPR